MKNTICLPQIDFKSLICNIIKLLKQKKNKFKFIWKRLPFWKNIYLKYFINVNILYILLIVCFAVFQIKNCNLMNRIVDMIASLLFIISRNHKILKHFQYSNICTNRLLNDTHSRFKSVNATIVL